jgi:hypothetical protein
LYVFQYTVQTDKETDLNDHAFSTDFLAPWVQRIKGIKKVVALFVTPSLTPPSLQEGTSNGEWNEIGRFSTAEGRAINFCVLNVVADVRSEKVPKFPFFTF